MRVTRGHKRRVEQDSDDEDNDAEDDKIEVKKERRQERRSVSQRNKKVIRRVSTRLREAAQSLRVSRRRRVPDASDDVDGEIVEKKSRLGERLRNSEEKSGKVKVRTENRKKSVVTNSRQRYKIRPIERVRTRGYSLMLASKNALKRAKRENVTLTKVTKVKSTQKTRSSATAVSDSPTNRSDVSEERESRSSSLKSPRYGERRSQNARSELPCIEDVIGRKGKTGSSERTRRKSFSQESGDVGSSVTRQGNKERTPSHVKKTPPKRSKHHTLFVLFNFYFSLNQ